MLLKWLFLLILAWYIYRAAGNLIDAVLGRREPRQHIRPPESSRPRAPHAPENGNARIEHRDIEDARWKDI